MEKLKLAIELFYLFYLLRLVKTQMVGAVQIESNFEPCEIRISVLRKLNRHKSCTQVFIFIYRRPFCVAGAQLPLRKASGEQVPAHRPTPTDGFSCGESGLHRT